MGATRPTEKGLGGYRRDLADSPTLTGILQLGRGVPRPCWLLLIPRLQVRVLRGPLRVSCSDGMFD